MKMVTFADHPLPDRTHRPYRSGLFVEKAGRLPLDEIVVIAPTGADRFNNEQRVVRPFTFSWKSFSSEQYNLFHRLKRILKLAFKVRAFVRHCGSPLLFRVTNGYLGIIAALVKRRGDVMVLDCCDFYFDLYREFQFPLPSVVCPVIFRLERMAIRRADVVIVDTPAQREYLAARFAVDTAKVAVLPNGVILEKYPSAFEKDAALSAQFGLEEDDQVLFYGGDISAMDGLEMAIDFVRANPALNGRRVKLIIVGKGKDEYIAELVKSASDLIAAGVVRFESFKPYDEYWRYMSLADVCLAPFRLTPTTANVECGKIITYLLAAKQVVSTEARGVRSIYGDSVIFFRDGDYESFSSAVRRAAGLPRTLESKLRQRKRGELFDFNRIMDAEVEVVDRLLKRLPLGLEEVEHQLGIATAPVIRPEQRAKT